MANLIPLDTIEYCIRDANGDIVSYWIRGVMLDGDDYWKARDIEDSDFEQDPPTLNAGETLEKCETEKTEFCVESQEWTYGIDNTSTITQEDAVITIGLSDGSSFDIQQTNQGSANQWTPQMGERGANIQAAADAAGIKWFVETRFIVPSGSLAGGGGFSGPPSESVGSALYAGGMRRRYVNIQICPGQPVPVSAVYNSDTRIDLDLTTAGAVLGPVQKFWICKKCGEEPVRYLEDGKTLASEGQIPNCYEPCGTLALADSPPDRECEFFFAEACDNVNDSDDGNRINLVTRRATICAGEQIAVDYFVPDPADATALIDYTLVGEFVDCDTGEAIPLPVPDCEDFVITTLYSLDNVTDGLIRSEYETGLPIATSAQRGDDDFSSNVMDTIDLSTATQTLAPTIVAGSLQMNDTDNSGDVQDIEYKEGYLIVESPIDVRRNTASEGALRVEVGTCCGELEEEFMYAKGVGTIPSPVISLGVGIHKIKLTNLDSGATNSSRNAETTADGITWTTNNTPSGVSFSTTKPLEKCKIVKVCKDTGVLISLLDNEVIDPTTCYECSLDCEATSGSSLISSSDVTKKEVCVISGENGINGQRRDSELNASVRDTNTNTFSTWNTHINGAPDEQVIITNNWSLNDLDFPLTGAYVAGTDTDISSQELYWAWINVTEDMILRDSNGNTGEYLSVYVQDCNKEMVQVVKDKYTTAASPGIEQIIELCPGIHKIAIQINDYSVYGGFFLQYSTDSGATWINFPITETYSQAPKKETKTVLCYLDGTITNTDGTAFTDKTIDCNLPCYPLTREVLPDVEVSIIDGCDSVDGEQANFVNITREVLFIDGEQTTTFYTDFGLDTQTEYTLVGSFVDCDTGEPIGEEPIIVDCADREILEAYTPSGTPGVNVERRNTNAITGGAATDVPSVIFNGGVDYSGMPAHDNGVPDSLIVETDLLILDQVNDESQFRYWTYMYVTEPIRLRESYPRAEAVDYFTGECGADAVKTATGAYPNTSAIVYDITLQPGIHYIGGEVYDFSAYSGVSYQYSTDNGVTRANVPTSRLYSDKPTIQKCPVKICPETGYMADITTGQLLGSETTLCAPVLCGATPTNLQCAYETFYKVNLGEIGTTEQQWTTSTPTLTAVTGVSDYLEGFDTLDTEGYPSSTIAPDAVITTTVARTTSINTGAGDMAQSDFWIYLEEDTDLREFGATAEASGVWISESCGSNTMVEVLNAPYLNTDVNPLGTYKQGCYRVRLYHTDVTVNGATVLQGLTDGTWSLLPAYQTKPTFDVVKGRACDDGNFYDLSKSTTLSPEEYSCEDPRCSDSCCSSSSSSSDSVGTLTIQP